MSGSSTAGCTRHVGMWGQGGGGSGWGGRGGALGVGGEARWFMAGV